MILNKASAHLYTNNIYTRKSSPTIIYLIKVNNRNTKNKCEIRSKLTIKIVEQLSTVFIVNFGYISHLFLVFLLLTLKK